MAKKKAPLERMEPLARAQTKEFNESKHLAGDFKNRLVDWSAGLHAVLTSFDQVVDPDNPPEAGSVHDLLIREGKKKRLLQNLLRDSEEDDAPPAGDTPPADSAPAPQAAAPQPPVAPSVALPVAPPVAAPVGSAAASLGM